MKIEIPKDALVILIGTSSSGKSTFAERNFKPTEVLSSDYYRALVSDDESRMDVTSQAFEALHFIADKRLNNGRLTVIDATNVQKRYRKPLHQLAMEKRKQTVAIVFDIPEEVCIRRHQNRSDRNFEDQVIIRQGEYLRRSMKNLHDERFSYIYILKTEEDVLNTEILRLP